MVIIMRRVLKCNSWRESPRHIIIIVIKSLTQNMCTFSSNGLFYARAIETVKRAASASFVFFFFEMH